MKPIDIRCEREGCGALPGEACKQIPRFDGQLPAGDPELYVSTVHHSRLEAVRVAARAKSGES